MSKQFCWWLAEQLFCLFDWADSTPLKIKGHQVPGLHSWYYQVPHLHTCVQDTPLGFHLQWPVWGTLGQTSWTCATSPVGMDDSPKFCIKSACPRKAVSKSWDISNHNKQFSIGNQRELVKPDIHTRSDELYLGNILGVVKHKNQGRISLVQLFHGSGRCGVITILEVDFVQPNE